MRAGRLPPWSSTPTARSRDTRPRTNWTPTEEPLYVTGHTRQLFEINGLKFGVAICHEGFRYPETVRWAAVRGAQVVFHPHCTGSDKTGVPPTQWGAASSPYYEKAMMCRGLENTIYFASVNYAFRYQESATPAARPGPRPDRRLVPRAGRGGGGVGGGAPGRPGDPD
jgi:predicted amidohydrolase